MKINKKNYLIYLVIFTVILLLFSYLFSYLFSDKNAIIRGLNKEFYGIDTQNKIEGLTNSLSNGLSWKVYDGYYNDPLNDTGMKALYSGQDLNKFSDITTSLDTMTGGIIRTNSYQHFFTIILTGYFMPNKTGYWKFQTSSDDASYLWLGSPAMNTPDRPNGLPTVLNTLVNNGGLHGNITRSSTEIYLTENIYYPIRIQMGENWGAYNLSVEWLAPGSSVWDSNGAGMFFYSNISNPSVAAQKNVNSGLKWVAYDGYFNDDVNYITKQTSAPALSGITNDTSGLSAITGGKILENVGINGTDPNNMSFYIYNIVGIEPLGCRSKGLINASGNGGNVHQFTIELVGYFYTYTTNTDPNKSWEFHLSSDEASYFWIGDKAAKGWTTQNADINHGNQHGMMTRQTSIPVSILKPNKYYPIRLIYGENCGGYNFRFGWKPPDGNWTTNGMGYLYYEDFSEMNNDHIYYSAVGSKKT